MEFSKETKKYWEEKDWKDLEKVESVKDLYNIAKRIIDRMPKPFVQVCGPITTGGAGSIEKNLDLFNNTITQLQNNGLVVFDQMPFEIPMQILKNKFSKEKILKEMLNDFYIPIIESKMASTYYFIPNWESSSGSKWEHKKAKEFGIRSE